MAGLQRTDGVTVEFKGKKQSAVGAFAAGEFPVLHFRFCKRGFIGELKLNMMVNQELCTLV